MTTDARVKKIIQALYPWTAGGIRPEPLAGDASFRQYFRLRLPMKQTRILAVYPEGTEEQMESFRRIAKYLRGFGLNVPHIYRTAKEHLAMIQEDLEDRNLQTCWPELDEESRQDIYKECLRIVARIQEASERAPDEECPCFQTSFDADLFEKELDQFYQYYILKTLKVSPKAEDEAAIREEFRGLSEEIASHPQVLCHRDFHSRNLMLLENQVRIVDLQDARLGPASYDAASLLRDSYIEIEPAFVETMSRYFHGLRKQSPAVPDEYDDFHLQLTRVGVQRNLKAVGTFAYQAVERNNESYNSYVPYTLGLVKSTFAEDSRFERMAELLGRWVPDLRP